MSNDTMEALELDETLIPEALRDVLAYVETEFGITALGYVIDNEDGSALEPLRLSESAA